MNQVPLVTVAPEAAPFVRVTFAELAKDTGMSESAVRKHVALAEKGGWLVVDRADKACPGFALMIPDQFRSQGAR
ncbi:hypothetical protein [Paraburkholderia sp. GAS348]|uniref:hypothetical protein n=1 Tax=Paraburkholderia sp. GAS348 TaxID=3035132 RepID=UPI003D1EDDF0